MATFFSIVKTALNHVQADPIELEADEAEATFSTADLDPVDEVESSVQSFYPQIRNVLMNAYPWTWMRAREMLVATSPHEKDPSVAETLPWAYRYRWHKPQQLVGNIRSVFHDQDARPQTEDWDAMGPYVFTNFAPAVIEFQRRMTEEAFPDLFEVAISLWLGSWLAWPVAADLDLGARLKMEAQDVLKEALKVDAQSHPAVHVEDFEYVLARVGAALPLPGATRGINV